MQLTVFNYVYGFFSVAIVYVQSCKSIFVTIQELIILPYCMVWEFAIKVMIVHFHYYQLCTLQDYFTLVQLIVLAMHDLVSLKLEQSTVWRLHMG